MNPSPKLMSRSMIHKAPQTTSAERSWIESIVVRCGRLGFTDVFHENVGRRGFIGRVFILLLGTPHLGTYANGIYLNRILEKRMFGRILDAGCGDGAFSLYVASKYPHTQVLGVDIGEQGLHGVETTLEIAERVQKKLQLPNLEFVRLDLRAMQFSSTFDFVYSFDVLEHITENETVLKNIYQSLVPGGQLLLRMPTRKQKRILSSRFTAEHEQWAAIEHVGQHHDMDGLLAVLRSIGFHVISARHTMGYWGRLSFELSEALKYWHVPAPLQFACVPALKLLRRIDTLSKCTGGDGLLVLCGKQVQ